MKLTKSEIKRLIMEEIGGPSNIKMNTGNSTPPFSDMLLQFRTYRARYLNG